MITVCGDGDDFNLFPDDDNDIDITIPCLAAGLVVGATHLLTHGCVAAHLDQHHYNSDDDDRDGDDDDGNESHRSDDDGRDDEHRNLF